MNRVSRIVTPDCGHEAANRPVRFPRDLQAIRRWGGCGWSFRWGAKRQLLFLPGFVVKLPMNLRERHSLHAEVGRGREAGRHPLWCDTALRARSLAGMGTISRRCAQVRLEDHGPISRLLTRKLEQSLDYAPAPLPQLLADSSVWNALPQAERRRLDKRLQGTQLPRSSMHGDLHMFNFVRSDQDYLLLDWEFFDEQGSFIYDFLDFHMTTARLNHDRHWHGFLDGLDADIPAFREASARCGVAPQELLLYYVCTKLDTLSHRARHRHGGWDRLPEKSRRRMTGIVAKASRPLAA